MFIFPKKMRQKWR